MGALCLLGTVLVVVAWYAMILVHGIVKGTGE